MNDLASFLSAEVGPLGARVEGYVRGHELIWRQAPAEPLPPKKRFACREKRAVEHTGSVLANGYLVAGRLDPADEDFCFGFGTFLQLADDLQDVAEDADCGHRTLF